MNVEEIIKTSKKIPLEPRTVIHLELVHNRISEIMTGALKPFEVSMQQWKKRFDAFKVHQLHRAGDCDNPLYDISRFEFEPFVFNKYSKVHAMYPLYDSCCSDSNSNVHQQQMDSSMNSSVEMTSMLLDG